MKLQRNIIAITGLLTTSGHLITPIQAATIAWGPPTTISAGIDVSTNGALVQAYNVGAIGVPSATVNGVPFAPFEISPNSDPFGGANVSVPGATINTPGFLASENFSFGSFTSPSPFSTLPASYQSLLRSGTFVVGQIPFFLLTIRDLSIGVPYEIQVWANQSEFGPNGFGSMTMDSIPLDVNTTDTGGGVGQFAIGTFTADSSTQTLQFLSFSSPAQINAYQVRAVPEPATTVLLFCGAALNLRRRSKRSTERRG